MGINYNPKAVTDGLILYLDAANSKSYPGTGVNWFDLSGNNNHFTLYNTPTFATNKLTFNGTNHYARSNAVLNFTSYTSVTVISGVRSTSIASGMVFEHTADWNANSGGLGLYLHSNGSTLAQDLHHTNHNTELARNYSLVVGTNWAIHANVFSNVVDSTGRVSYGNGNLLAFSATGGYATGTATTAGSFANSYMYIGSRGGTSGFLPADLSFIKVYNKKLTAAEVQQNFNALRGRYGI